MLRGLIHYLARSIWFTFFIGIGLKKVRTALVSVFSKDGLEPLVKCLRSQGVTLYSTGGTYTYIKALGLPVHPVEELTSYPSILGGRVKTLHPKVFGGILSRRGDSGDAQELDRYEIPEIDMVVVDLYPFRETVAQGGSESEIIEKIDIGGISLIRAAAKNHQDVLIVPDKDAYGDVQKLLEEKGGHSEAEDRKRMATRAFAVSAEYDKEINRWMSGSKELRYGENPHQKGRFIGDLSEAFEQLHGKELSYNNLLDIDSAWWLLDEFEDTTFAILKHNNACGIASRDSLTQAWEDALEADPVSAFGGVLAANRTIDAEVAEKIDKLFFEILMAPDFSPEALHILQSKKNRILLRTRAISGPEKQLRSILNGVLEQDPDDITDSKEDLKVVTKRSPSKEEEADLLFASKVSKHTRSNTIVIAKDRRLIGSGTGQTSRVDALRQALNKAEAFQLDTEGAVMASDAFFPFPDCVEIAHEAGVEAVIQPGGSVKDELSVNFCDASNMAMVFTGHRHFKH